MKRKIENTSGKHREVRADIGLRPKSNPRKHIATPAAPVAARPADAGVRRQINARKHSATAATAPVMVNEVARLVAEPIQHAKMIRAARAGYSSNTASILGDATHKPENVMTPLEKMGLVRTGVTKKDLENLKKIAGLGYDELAKALSVTRATLINKKGKEKFNTVLSERIVSLADIYSYGYEVFEDEGRFNQWMFRPNKALSGQAPYDLLDNQFGREEVRNIIGRIEFGVYS